MTYDWVPSNGGEAGGVDIVQRERQTTDLVASAISGRAAGRTLQSQVLHKLGVMIVSGEIAPGDILPADAELLERFDVSRTVLREALKALAAKNMVEARAGVGTRVRDRRHWSLFDPDVLAWHFEAGPDIDFLRSLAEIRVGIELESTALAAMRRSPEQIDHMFVCVDGMQQARRTEDFARHDLAFHRTVAEASGNLFMASISGLVDMALASAFTMSSPVDEPVAHETTVAHHRRVAQAVHDRDADAARAAMRIVIAEGFERAAGRMSGEAWS
jgi:DNA-binding FadR family transcriptional regulator